MKGAINRLKSIEGYSETDDRFKDVVVLVKETESYVLKTDDFKLLEAYRLLSKMNEQLRENNLDPVELNDYRKITDQQSQMINIAINRAETLLSAHKAEATAEGKEIDSKFVALEESITKAKANDIDSLSEKSAQHILDELNKNIVECGGKSVLSSEVEAMTEEQRTVLLKAINNAKTIEGFTEDPVEGEDPFIDLKKLIKDSQDVLTSETGNNSTKAYAQYLIDNINIYLVENGMKAVTEYNTIVHKLPVGSEILDVTNFVDFATTIMHPSGSVGKTMINAVVLTKNGVVLNVNKEITVYEAIESANIYTDSEKSKNFKVNDTLDFSVFLKQKQIKYKDPLGNILCFVLNVSEESTKQYIALYRIDTEDKKEISFDIDNNIVYEDGSKVFNNEDYSITLIDGKLTIKKAQVNSSGEYVQNIVFSTVYEADCDQLLYADKSLNLYYMQDKNVICINLEGEKIFNSEAYLVDDQFSGYVIAKNITKTGRFVYITEEGKEAVLIGNINIDNIDSWQSGQIYEVTNNTEVGEDIEYCVWSTSNIEVFKVIEEATNSCTIQGVNAGQAYLTVTVYTEQGNNYTVSCIVKVNPAENVDKTE